MTRRELIENYFHWLCEFVDEDGYSDDLPRRELLRLLHQTPFTYILPMDANRFDEGVNLRYRFGTEAEVDSRVIASQLDDRPCSMLEMMVALCVRCEEQIMCNADIGDRTGKWFNDMLDSLGLTDIDDDNEGYEEAVTDILERFMNREYEPDGHGGLFTLTRRRHDMRNAEIWYQAMWYLDEVLQGTR